MFRKLLSGFFGLVFLAGLSMILYPSVSNWLNEKNASKVIASYDSAMESMDVFEFDRLKESAYSYNDWVAESGSLSYAVRSNLSLYHSVLNVSDDGVMGVIRIPKLDVRLPIYHGSSDSVLQRAVGHYEGSSLPIGGVNSHCLLTGHRGLPSAKLFTNLDELVEGDLFFIDVLDEVHAYEVDSICTVLPDEVDNLNVIEGRDLVTLITCTPYGVNSHRLLVRGSRVDYVLEEHDSISSETSSLSAFYIVFGLVIFFLVVIFAFKKWRRLD